MVWENPPGRRPQQAPEIALQEMIRKLREQFRSWPFFRGPLWIIVLVALIALVTLNSYYTIEPQETGVIQRFGKYVGTADAGLHFKIPFGIDSVKKVVTGRVLQHEYGYRTVVPDVRSRFVEKGYEEEAVMLSGDLNVVNTQWTVQYKIQDPVAYLFQVNGVESTLDDISESVMRRIVGNRYADEVFTVGRASIADAARKEIQEIIDIYKTGLQIVTVKLQNVNPPNAVKAAFNEVNEARQEKERMINEAEQAYNQKIPKAVGEARQTVSQAEGYALERVNRSEGEVKRFLDILAEYQKAPEVTRRRMYIESLENLLGKVSQLYVIDQDQKSLLPLFDIGRSAGRDARGPQAGGPAQQNNP
jgi:modulator of FtsH protease HflK